MCWCKVFIYFSLLCIKIARNHLEKILKTLIFAEEKKEVKCLWRWFYIGKSHSCLMDLHHYFALIPSNQHYHGNLPIVFKVNLHMGSRWVAPCLPQLNPTQSPSWEEESEHVTSSRRGPCTMHAWRLHSLMKPGRRGVWNKDIQCDD